MEKEKNGLKTGSEVMLSIIIVNWNTCEDTCNCLESIYLNSPDLNFEIILIDNASTDNSVKIIKDKFPYIILIENCINIGFGPANNLGLSIAQGEFILFLNSDTIVHSQTLKKTIHQLELQYNIGAIGCKVLNKDFTLQSTLFKYPNIISLFRDVIGLSVFSKDKPFSNNRYSRDYYNQDHTVEVLAGCYIMCPKSVVDMVGGFDKEFFMYGEEIDFCKKIQNKGLKIYYYSEVTINHLIGTSTSKSKSKMVLRKKAGLLRYFRKHHSYFYYLVCCLLVSLWFGLRIIPRIVKAIINPKNFKDSIKIIIIYTIGSISSLFGLKMLEYQDSNIEL